MPSSPKIDAAVARLSSQLPLAARQAALPAELAALHVAILRSLYERGNAPSRDECAALLAATPLDEALKRLGDSDLAVLSAGGKEVLGAYPMTAERTPHHVSTATTKVNAMCALDAVAVAPMFGGEVEINSVCRHSGQAVRIRQLGSTVLEAEPSSVRVGVRWQMPCSTHAAHSMCVEMVFLKDAAAAQAWSKGDTAHHSVFTLEEAIAFGARFFCPLVPAAARA
jgi:mercuric reductase